MLKNCFLGIGRLGTNSKAFNMEKSKRTQIAQVKIKKGALGANRRWQASRLDSVANRRGVKMVKKPKK